MRRAAAASLTLAALLMAGAAGAQAADTAAAAELFRQGRAALEAGDYAAACPKLEESLRFDARVGTAISLAECEEAVGRTASARAHWMQAAGLARGLGDSRVAFAEQRFAEIDPKVPRLTIRAPEETKGTATVRRDGVDLGMASLGVALPVEVGVHVIEAGDSGHAVGRVTVELAAGESKEVFATLGPALPPAETITAPAASPSTGPGPKVAARQARFAMEIDGLIASWEDVGGQVIGCAAPQPARGGAGTTACKDAYPAFLIPGAGAELDGLYELPSGLGFGAGAGYLGLSRSVSNRPTSFTQGSSSKAVLVTDDIALSGLLLGGAAHFRFGDPWPITLRVRAGAYVAAVSDARTPTSAPSSAMPVTESHGATYFYTAPEVRIGRRLSEHLQVDLGLELLILLAPSQPRWSNQSPAAAGGTYPIETLTGTPVLVLAPGLGGRYDF